MSMTESERYTWWDDGEAYSNYIRPAVTKRLAEYEDVGTVSEFRELKEKATAKPVNQERGFDKCPNCGEVLNDDCGEQYNFCPDCGQKLLWN